MTLIRYQAEPTPAKFHASDAFYRCLMGPVRSGKSVASCAEVFRRMVEQKPGEDKKRRSRFAVIRNTYGELLDTTCKTWFDWFPEDPFGEFNRNDMIHRLKFKDVEAEIMFRALDRPDHVKKLLSLELTGAWINEAREVPKVIVDALGDRVGQYPSLRDGGCTWSGVIMDYNPPDDDSWLYRLAEIERPQGWDFFRQPGGLVERDGQFIPNPAAENVHNLNDGADYYVKRLAGKNPDYIRVYYCAQYGYVQEGKPVHEAYVDAVHCAHEDLRPTPGLPITIGIDFGLTPAAVFCQRQTNGRWLVLDELVSERMGISRFTDELKPMMSRTFPGYQFHVFGDPAGSQESQTDEQTPFQILEQKGINCQPAYHNNDPIVRRESLYQPLTRLVDGKPGFLLSPRCRITRKALAGGYCYRRKKISGDERYHDYPDKNKYSHPAEALEYALLGEGEGAAVLTKQIDPAFLEGFRDSFSGFGGSGIEGGWML